jgi:hypothetical protein
MIFNNETKERTFHLWDEYMYYLDLLSQKYPTKEFIKALIQIQLERKNRAEIFHERSEKPRLNLEKKSKDMDKIEKIVTLAWEKLIIEAFYYLQEARIMGGTLGHKVGPIWSFQKSVKEKYEGEILKLKYTTLFKNNYI